MDMHLPFTDPECMKIVKTVGPEYVTHEMSAPSADERIAAFEKQLSLFRR
jgi:hypothetical protein